MNLNELRSTRTMASKCHLALILLLTMATRAMAQENGRSTFSIILMYIFVTAFTLTALAIIGVFVFLFYYKIEKLYTKRKVSTTPFPPKKEPTKVSTLKAKPLRGLSKENGAVGEQPPENPVEQTPTEPTSSTVNSVATSEEPPRTEYVIDKDTKQLTPMKGGGALASQMKDPRSEAYNGTSKSLNKLKRKSTQEFVGTVPSTSMTTAADARKNAVQETVSPSTPLPPRPPPLKRSGTEEFIGVVQSSNPDE